MDCWKIQPKIVQQFSHKTNQNVEIGLHYNVTNKSQFENYFLCLVLVLFGKPCILALNYIKIAHKLIILPTYTLYLHNFENSNSEMMFIFTQLLQLFSLMDKNLYGL